jgi:hypothetical protein
MNVLMASEFEAAFNPESVTIEYFPETDLVTCNSPFKTRIGTAAMLGTLINECLEQKILNEDDVLTVVQVAFDEFEEA